MHSRRAQSSLLRLCGRRRDQTPATGNRAYSALTASEVESHVLECGSAANAEGSTSIRQYRANLSGHVLRQPAIDRICSGLQLPNDMRNLEGFALQFERRRPTGDTTPDGNDIITPRAGRETYARMIQIDHHIPVRDTFQRYRAPLLSASARLRLCANRRRHGGCHTSHSAASWCRLYISAFVL